ncbi:C4-dicarboxylic acid transporter DauA [Shewanella algae]|uniref:C4-dicarboxylic acid transporter DauA n=1 Tax=Shewanella algae TaxID=38313 RepID=UPI000D14D5A7|nr:C4-dicarboxylic acid transporter DauA [Shewanella algae]MBC8797114.1 C4-dicarboxylic acid transporter DauA [Shewanella algae]MBO2565965.1 C4-dicarboxylic acid transporter DauA [Shewanella algae]MBO2570221.1 C4-dicarboxylic acid transporter DauA [Shewanella algae]MBO2587415.1 C4-dicarboxylic acid transporter DauA [Shewanella algae]MBO2598705.1 C4-dicarboxylic acid transporter DauA [Shewanella algae]
MPHISNFRTQLFSLRLGHALREVIAKEGYSGKHFGQDLMAGVTVGIIAIPLAMALAIASGVAPQYGLYTAIIAGFIIAITGGSRYSISGPTAAFVVLLYPIAQEFGLAGLLMAGMMSGVILIAMALLRLGRLIQYIPQSVTLGFTAGIGVVIAVLQLKDFFGLPIDSMPEQFGEKLQVLALALPQTDFPSLVVALVTLVVMLLWPKLKLPVPAHLPAIIVGSLLALLLGSLGLEVETIGSRFHYLLPDGSQGNGIPPFLPSFEWPWLQPGPDGEPLGLSWQMVKALAPAAFAIAMLGAIESLLCAVVLDGMTGKRHSANSELLGQGIGNIVAPFFGGITATAAIARSAANVKAGAFSPVSAIIHSLVVLLGLVALAGLLSFLPMAAMAALLLVVAWNMSEAPKAWQLLKTAPRSDIWVFLSCFFLTVVFDMVIAISFGIMLAALLFMKEIAEMTRLYDISNNKRYIDRPLPDDWVVLKINGPLFFAAAERIFAEIAQMTQDKQVIVLYMDGVSILDAGGMAALNKLIRKCQSNNTRLLVADLQFQPIRTLAKAKVQPIEGVLKFYPTLRELIEEQVPQITVDSTAPDSSATAKEKPAQ